MNQFIKGVLTEQLIKLVDDKLDVDDRISTHQKELKRLLPIQEAMAKDIKETEAFLATEKKVVKKKG